MPIGSAYTETRYPIVLIPRQEVTFTGTVTEIRPIGAARQNATYFDVRITAPKEATVLPGMNATVIIP